MVQNAATTRSTGVSGFAPAATLAGESSPIRRGPARDLERNVGDGDVHADRRGFPGKKFWKFHMRPPDDDLPQDWWFASTAIPLLAATVGPLANVLSIAALVTTWRVTLPDNGRLPLGKDENGIAIADPRWEIVWNAVSLSCGFIGNLALLFNFTRKIRYIVALPLTIIFWYLATGILIGITVAMNQYAAPIRPGQTYSQGFWYAVFAGCFYLFGSVILMINIGGYLLGHYPQHFELDDDQRTLILQTMFFFFWLAGGAGVFHVVCGFSYADALYFCIVTLTTVGFGDFVANNNVSRGIIFPYSVGGIIFLGLVINSIRNFAVSMSRDNIVKAHQRRERERTIGRTVTSERSLRLKLGIPPRRSSEIQRTRTGMATSPSQNRGRGNSLSEFGTLERRGHVVTFHQKVLDSRPKIPSLPTYGKAKALSRDNPLMSRGLPSRREKILVLREEKDRFDAMRRIQQNTKKFKQYYALSMSVLAFGILWCVGALVFMIAERRQQNLGYFEALYFSYVSLLSIGYGDFSPQSNLGKPFFVVWSLIAVPTMTILISDMGETVISAIKRGSFTVADWTVLPRAGVWHDFVMKHPRLYRWLQSKQQEREEKKRIERGFQLNDPDEQNEEEINPLGSPDRPLTLERLAHDGSSNHDLARKLALSIKKVANDLRTDPPVRYSYEEWVEFTRLIRFSTRQWGKSELAEVEEEEGLVEWDWIGENSPMLADETESQWVLDRLCESLNRYTRREAKAARDVMHGTGHSDWEWRWRRRRRGSVSSGEENIRSTMDGQGEFGEEGEDVAAGHANLSRDSQPLEPVTLEEEAEKPGDLS